LSLQENSMAFFTRKKTKILVYSLVALAFSAALAAAQTQAPSTTATTDPLGRSSPRGTMFNFLRTAREGNYAAACAYLETHGKPYDPGDPVAIALAKKLQTVLDSWLNVNLTDISDEKGGRADDGLPEDEEQIGVVRVADIRTPIILHLSSSPNSQGEWLFSSDTLRQIPELYDRVQPSTIEEHLPVLLVQQRFLGVALWRWLGLLLLLPLAALLASMVSWTVLRIACSLSRRTMTFRDNLLVGLLHGPMRLFLAVLCFHAGLAFLQLPFLLRQEIRFLELVSGVVAITWFALRMIDVAAAEARATLMRHRGAAAISMIPMGRRIVKVLALTIAVLAVLGNAGMDIKAILTGLGIGGLALALAAQKTLENVFAGVALVLDQPVRVGDFCKFGEQVGTVEDIGFRSTRIRTLDRTLISIPNTQFSTINIENFGPRDMVWFHPLLELRLDTTVDQLRYILAAIRKMLHEHPKVAEGARVRFNGFGNAALTLEVSAYVSTSDFDTFLPIQEDLLIRMLEIIEEAGTGDTTRSENRAGPTDRARMA
jgi:MscS family membrane protein